METITFSFKDPGFRDGLKEIIGADPSNIKISTLLFDYRPKKGDQVIAYSKEKNNPLVILRAGKPVYNFDLSIARQFSFLDSKRPKYTYLPLFNIRKIPSKFRRYISNIVASKSHSFNKTQDVIEYHRRLPIHPNDFITILLNKIDSHYLNIKSPIYKWPQNKKAAFISLHDVDSDRLLKLKKKDPLLSTVNKHGIKGTWYFLTTVIEKKGRGDLAFLEDDGHELGWHGYNHDHRLPFGRHTKRRIKHLNRSILVDLRGYPLGMRTPKLLKTKHLFDSLEANCPTLSFDTSFLHGIVPYYFSDKESKHRILEIPTTVLTDIRLYNELSFLPEAKKFETILKIQIERTDKLIELGGLISIATHPETDITERPGLLEIYDKYLSYLRSRDDIWFTTAGSIYEYWMTMHQNKLKS